MGYAFRVRWLWQRRAEQPAWRALPEKHEDMVEAVFRAGSRWHIGDGKSFLFWLDPWVGTQNFSVAAPHLFSAIRWRARTKTVADALRSRAWVRDIAGALSVPVLLDYLMIWELTDGVHLDETRPDCIRWFWTADGAYSAASAYASMFVGASHPLDGAAAVQARSARLRCLQNPYITCCWVVCTPGNFGRLFWVSLALALSCPSRMITSSSGG